MTCSHVLEEFSYYHEPTNFNPLEKEGSSADIIFNVKEGKEAIAFTGTIKKVDDENDLAVIRVGVTKKLCTPFSIKQNDTYLNYLTKVQIISYPLGVGPIISRGFISGIQTFDYDIESYITNAQTAPGSSGGPVIDLNSGKVIGVLRAVLKMNSRGQLLGWCSIITPAEAVRNFVNEYRIQEAQSGGVIVVVEDAFPSLKLPATPNPYPYPKLIPGLGRGEKKKRHVNKGILVIMEDYFYTESEPQVYTTDPFTILKFNYETTKITKSYKTSL